MSKCRHCKHWEGPLLEGEDGNCNAEADVSLKGAPACVELIRYPVAAGDGGCCDTYEPKQIMRVVE